MLRLASPTTVNLVCSEERKPMHDADVGHRQAVALFRYGRLIADLMRLEPGSKGLYAQIEQKAAGEYTIPGSTRTRVAAETLRDWLKRYRRGGFDALLPKPRADRGQLRALPAPVVDVLLEIKEGNPALSVQLVIREARKRPEVPEELPLPGSTVHRLLARHGLMDKPQGNNGDADRRRFAFQQAGELWMSDVMHGPSVFVGDRTKRKTYLIAFIDDAALVSEKITLRFDPAAAPARPVQVCHQGTFVEQVRPVETYANCFVKRHRPSCTLNVEGPAPAPPPSGLKLRTLPEEER